LTGRVPVVPAWVNSHTEVAPHVPFGGSLLITHRLAGVNAE